MKTPLFPIGTFVCALALWALASPCCLAAPKKGTGSFTLYFVAEVEGEVDRDGPISLTLRDGKKIRVRLAKGHTRKANIEGTVVSTDPETGERFVSNIVKVGSWEDLPKGWEGRGNRMNPLVKYRTVAADQRRHPFGSRVFVAELKGATTPDGHTLDGYFWVGDVGGGIKGNFRFDIFVGDEPVYMKLVKEGAGKWKAPVEVDNLPSAPKGYSPRTGAGVKKTLAGLGYEVGDEKSVTSALTEFQKKHSQIPAIEHGSARGAVTTWFLTQAALAVSKGKGYSYGGEPGGVPPEKQP